MCLDTADNGNRKSHQNQYYFYTTYVAIKYVHKLDNILDSVHTPCVAMTVRAAHCFTISLGSELERPPTAASFGGRRAVLPRIITINRRPVSENRHGGRAVFLRTGPACRAAAPGVARKMAPPTVVCSTASCNQLSIVAAVSAAAIMAPARLNVASNWLSAAQFYIRSSAR